MSKNKIIFAIGLILIVLSLPSLGLPPSWKSAISVLAGITLLVLSFAVAAKRRASSRRSRRLRRDIPAEQVSEKTSSPTEVETATVSNPSAEDHV